MDQGTVSLSPTWKMDWISWLPAVVWPSSATASVYGANRHIGILCVSLCVGLSLLSLSLSPSASLKRILKYKLKLEKKSTRRKCIRCKVLSLEVRVEDVQRSWAERKEDASHCPCQSLPQRLANQPSVLSLFQILQSIPNFQKSLASSHYKAVN